jgi:hypothetical protein
MKAEWHIGGDITVITNVKVKGLKQCKIWLWTKTVNLLLFKLAIKIAIKWNNDRIQQ